MPIDIPRDRDGRFEPQLIAKHQTRWTGFDDKILSLYARGMTVREIQSHLEEMYGTAVSPTLISSVAADLRTIYTAATVEEAAIRLAEFDVKWGKDYPPIVQSWQRNWPRVVPFFDYPAEIRKVITPPTPSSPST